MSTERVISAHLDVPCGHGVNLLGLKSNATEWTSVADLVHEVVYCLLADGFLSGFQPEVLDVEVPADHLHESFQALLGAVGTVLVEQYCRAVGTSPAIDCAGDVTALGSDDYLELTDATSLQDGQDRAALDVTLELVVQVAFVPIQVGKRTRLGCLLLGGVCVVVRKVGQTDHFLSVNCENPASNTSETDSLLTGMPLRALTRVLVVSNKTIEIIVLLG